MLALMKYGDRAASTRQRLLQYQRHLSRVEIDVDVLQLLNNDYLAKTFDKNTVPIVDTCKSYIARAIRMLNLQQYDLIWVHSEAFPYLPGLAERAVFAGRRPVVYDFDDAIFHQYDMHKELLIRFLLSRKLQPLMRGAKLCICGNNYLWKYASQYCQHSVVIPTVVDVDVYEPALEPETHRAVTMGWIGSPSTWTFVKPLIPLLTELATRLNLTVRIVGAGPQKNIPPRFEFLPWSEAEEIHLIQSMDIGIMPLPDEPWARGKCGYKLIQYMACGLPVVASPVGVNTDIVDHGLNGFLASIAQEWAEAVTALAADAALRRRMGAEGRRKIERAYSLTEHGPRLAKMLREVIEANQPYLTNKRASA